MVSSLEVQVASEQCQLNLWQLVLKLQNACSTVVGGNYWGQLTAYPWRYLVAHGASTFYTVLLSHQPCATAASFACHAAAFVTFALAVQGSWERGRFPAAGETTDKVQPLVLKSCKAGQ